MELISNEEKYRKAKERVDELKKVLRQPYLIYFSNNWLSHFKLLDKRMALCLVFMGSFWLGYWFVFSCLKYL